MSRATAETAIEIAPSTNAVAARPATASNTRRGSIPASGTITTITGSTAAGPPSDRTRPAPSAPRTTSALVNPLARTASV